jgi:GH24 family phage-related lysozyme (muramidase)
VYLDDAVKNTEEFEGRVNHMYLDTKGNVTVAVGQMLADVAAAQALPFKRRGMGEDIPASEGEIAEEFNRVKASSPGHAAHYYFTTLFLEDADMDRLLRVFLADIDAALFLHFSRYNDWPDAAKLGYLDMGYNLGPHRLFTEYPHMNAAAADGQWLTCAAQCEREKGSPAFDRRNAWTRQQFRDAWAKRT